MKKRETIAGIIVLCMISLSACKVEVKDHDKEDPVTGVKEEISEPQTAPEQQNTDMLYDDLVKPNGKDYWMFEGDNCILKDDDIAVYTAEDTYLTNPSGICVFGNELVVADQDANALYRYDLDCNYLGTVGKQGMAEVEFNMPMALDVYRDQLYILDSGNYRVQVLDQNYEFVSEYQLNPQHYSNGGGIYWDLAVKNENCIYVSTSSSGYLETRIARIDENGQTDFEDVFCGRLCKYEGEIYAVNTLEYTVISENRELFSSGEHHFYRIDDMEMTDLWRFPDDYTPLDFIMSDGKVIVISGSKDRIDMFSPDGELIQQICKQNAFTEANHGIDMAPDGTLYYIDAEYCKLFQIPPAYERD